MAFGGLVNNRSLPELAGCVVSSGVVFLWFLFADHFNFAEQSRLTTLTVAMSTIFSLVYMIWHGTGARMNWYTITPFHRASNDYGRSMYCCAALTMIFLSVAWEVAISCAEYIADLPFDPYGIRKIFVGLALLFWMVYGIGMCIPLFYILYKDSVALGAASKASMEQRSSPVENRMDEKYSFCIID